MKETTKIELDLSCRTAPKKLYAKQGDIDSRFVTASFCIGDTKFDHTQALRSEIRVKKPDGTITVNEGEISDEGITYPLSEQSLNVAGNAQVDFLLYGSGDEVISCVPALLFITEAPSGDDAVVSTNEYTAFRSEVTSLNENLTAFEKTYSQQMAQMGMGIGDVKNKLGGLTLVKTTQDEYKLLDEADDSTLYYTEDDLGVTRQYLGSVLLSSGFKPISLKLLRATGTQHINTGFTPSSRSLKYVAKLANVGYSSGTDRGSVIGGVNESANMRTGGVWIQSGYDSIISIGTKAYFLGKGIPMITEPSIVTITVEQYTVSVTLEDESGNITDFGSETYSGNLNVPFFIFSGTASQYHTNGEIYYLQIYENGELVRDLVPQLAGGVPALYDKVGDKYYYNDGSGEFEYEALS